jgi:hypothetical protein
MPVACKVVREIRVTKVQPPRPGVRIDGVELGCFDQGVGDGGGLAAYVGADEEVVLAAEGDGAHGAFGCVVIELKDAVVEVGPQALHPGEGVSDDGSERGFFRDLGELHSRPSLQIVEDRGGMGVAEFGASIRWRPPGLPFHSIKLGDPADGFFGDPEHGEASAASRAKVASAPGRDDHREGSGTRSWRDAATADFAGPESKKPPLFRGDSSNVEVALR